MKQQLTKDQEKYLPALKWLVNSPIATGKTYLLATAFIECAVENPGKELVVFDHFPGHRNQELLLQAIFNLWEHCLDFKNDFLLTLSSSRLTIKATRK